MASVRTVWGIDIGKCALKALKLAEFDGGFRVEAFDVVEYPKLLSQPDADRDQLVRGALDRFLTRNSVSGSRVVTAAPGQSGFTRFVKLPPVETKQIPEIVKFEAEQQIPFNIDEVIWRWQAFADPDSPDIEVGIFAMKRTDVAEVLDRFREVNVAVDVVQMAPLALLNFMNFDGQAAAGGATLLVDVGADKTDLVISDGPRIWTRTLQLGGNNFTESLVKGFKLDFAKAEKLKRSAATSKYARQIFQVMRPVFAELVQEIQRSLGYYISLHRESRFKRVVGLGNGFRLPGLQKFLEQNLNIPVLRVDSFNKLQASPSINAPAFVENVPAFAVAYGLALQGLDVTKIKTNLLPSDIQRHRRWARKNVWFAGAAAMILACFGAVTWRTMADKAVLNTSDNPNLNKVVLIVNDGKRLQGDFNKVCGQDEAQLNEIRKYFDMDGYRSFWPTLDYVVSDALMKVARQQGLMTWSNKKQLEAIPRPKREVVIVEKLFAVYVPDAGKADLDAFVTGGGVATPAPGPVSPAASFGPGAIFHPGGMGPAPSPGAGGKRGFMLYLEGRTPHAAAVQFLEALRLAVGESAKPFPYLQITPGKILKVELDRSASVTGSSGTERATRDPLTGEDISGDAHFVLGWVVTISGDGLPTFPTGPDTTAGGAE